MTTEPTTTMMMMTMTTTAAQEGNNIFTNGNNNLVTSCGIIGITTSGAASAADTTTTATATTGLTSLASLEFLYFKAVSFYRRRNYEKCTELCNALLQAGHANNVQMFAAHNAATADDSEQTQQYPTNHHHQLQLQHLQHHGSNMAVTNNNYNKNNNNNNSNVNGNSNISSNLQRAAQRHGRRQYASNNNNNRNTGIGSSTGSHSTMLNNNSKPMHKVVMPTWLMEGVWQLKMRALTQRIYVDDLETNDDANAVNEEVEFERIATAARPGTSIKTAFVPRPSTAASTRAATARMAPKPSAGIQSSDGRKLTTSMMMMGARPTSGMARPGTGLSRPGSASGGRPASRCGTASRVRNASAAAFISDDATASLYQASRYNPTIYADRQILAKALFQFVFYHEADVQKAFAFCEAVMDCDKKRKHMHAGTPTPDWWWKQQLGRCLLTLRYPRKAETYLLESLAVFPHPDTYLLLSRVYQRLEKPEKAMELITSAVDCHPFNVTFRTEQGRIYDLMSKAEDAVQIYRLIAKLNPINIEALACIAVNYFYDNNPEMALMYYRRILSLGVHSPELYCNIALCCLYGGQIDLVLPCFQRALRSAKTPEQKADIWYNLSFVAVTTGDFNLAKRCLQLCLTSDARNGAALNNLAVLSAHNGDLMKAKSYLSAAKDVLQDSLEIESNLEYMEQHYKL